jgi:hypothetical protein
MNLFGRNWKQLLTLHSSLNERMNFLEPDAASKTTQPARL